MCSHVSFQNSQRIRMGTQEILQLLSSCSRKCDDFRLEISEEELSHCQSNPSGALGRVRTGIVARRVNMYLDAPDTRTTWPADIFQSWMRGGWRLGSDRGVWQDRGFCNPTSM